ncbi:MAG: hypothetical protein CEO21_431, partial [Microgenomates group bacterium Gr01-1014_80]
MSIEPVIFFDMAATIFILSIALVAVVFYFGKVIKKQHSEGDIGNLSETHQKAVKIIDEA